MLEFLMNNWAIILVAFLALIGILVTPQSKRVAKVKEWLLWAVAQAEIELGSGTGEIKLRYVYDLFVSKFPFVSKLISFETFNSWVEEALEELEALIESNDSIKNLFIK